MDYDEHTVGYTTQKIKPITNYLNNILVNVLKEEHVNVIGITQVYNPADVELDEAWERILDDIKQIHEVLQKDEEVMFILTGIELHEGDKRIAPPKPRLNKLNLNNKDYHKELSDKVRQNRVLRDQYEDELLQGQNISDLTRIDKKNFMKLIRKFDDEYGFVQTSGIDPNNGRSIVLDVNTYFPIYWDHKDDNVGNRYYVLKEQYKEKDVGLTLEGYPHLHSAIGYVNTKGINKEFTKISADLYHIIPDIRLGSSKGGKGKAWDDPAHLIGYVIKNSRHSKVNEKLKEYYSSTYIHTIFNAVRSTKRVTEAFLSIPMTILTSINRWDVDGDLPAFIPRIKDEIITSVKSKTGDSSEAMNRIRYVMEKNNLAVHDGRIYMLKKGTKMTWEPWSPKSLVPGSISEFIASAAGDNSDYVLEHRKVIEDIMMIRSQIRFPTVKIDCQWIELNDGFLFLGKGLVTSCNDKYPCFINFSDIKMNDISKGKDYFYPEKFMKIIINSCNKDLCEKLLIKLFTLYLPRKHKDSVLYLYGDANSGKTTLIEVVSGILPENKKSYLNNSKFSLSALPGRVLLILDEGIGVGSLDYGILLKLLEGNSTIPVDVKHQQGISPKININIIMSTNEDLYPSYTAYRSPSLAMFEAPKDYRALNKRLTKFRFSELKNCVPGGKEQVTKEQSKVIMFLFCNYYGKEIKFMNEQNDVDNIYQHWLLTEGEMYNEQFTSLEL